MSKNLYIVEGKDDISRLKSAGAHFVLATNGKYVKKQFIDFLKLAQSHRKIVLVFDPDGPGKNIASFINSQISSSFVVEAEKKKCLGKTKVGIAEAETAYIKKLLAVYLDEDASSEEKDSISIQELNAFLLNGKGNKDKLLKKYNLEDATNKKLCEYLCVLGIKTTDLEDAVNERRN
jgi:ribonuclease M5